MGAYGQVTVEWIGEDRWKVFKSHSSMNGLEVGVTKLDEVARKIGISEIPVVRKKHHLSRACYKNAKSNVGMEISTGVLNDYNTLYGVKVKSGDLDSDCRTSELLDAEVVTPGGLKLGLSKSEVYDLLGQEFIVKEGFYKWGFDYREVFSKPKISIHESGPKRARYKSKYIQKGLYHYAKISIKFENNRVQELEVFDAIESDFKIEPIGDSPY